MAPLARKGQTPEAEAEAEAAAGRGRRRKEDYRIGGVGAAAVRQEAAIIGSKLAKFSQHPRTGQSAVHARVVAYSPDFSTSIIGLEDRSACASAFF